MDLLKEFAAHLLAAGNSARTVDGYSSQIKAFAKWLAAKTGAAPSMVTPLDLAEYKRELAAEGKKPSTVNAAIHALRAFMASWGAMWPSTYAQCRNLRRLHPKRSTGAASTAYSGRHRSALKRQR